MSVEIKLESKGGAEQRILEYLQENASEALAEKINAGNKTLAGAVKFATDEAKKMAGGDGCVCVADATVFGWIIHFFEETGIKEKSAVKMPGGVKVKKAKTEAGGQRPEKKVSAPKMTMFEQLFAGGK
jgi:hypothetical protein